MENIKKKYKGFANAAEYVEDIYARYTVFQEANADYVAYLKQKEESGEYDLTAYNDPQDIMNANEMIKIIDASEDGKRLLENQACRWLW